MEAMRCLKRRISDAIYRQLAADAGRAALTASPGRMSAGPGGHCGASQNPARSTFPRTSTLRISHFPDPHPRRYAGLPEAERPQRNQSSKRPVDNRREPECSGSSGRTRRTVPFEEPLAGVYFRGTSLAPTAEGRCRSEDSDAFGPIRGRIIAPTVRAVAYLHTRRGR